MIEINSHPLWGWLIKLRERVRTFAGLDEAKAAKFLAFFGFL